MAERPIEIDLPLEFENLAHQALVSVWWTGLLLKREARTFFKPLGSSESHFNLLAILANAKEPLSQKDLGDRLLVDKSNITAMVDGMEEAGLIRRKRVAADRRRYHVTLTAKGRTLATRLEGLYLERVEGVMKTLTAREHTQLIELTTKLRRGLAELKTPDA